jgi:hypothetical protein
MDEPPTSMRTRWRSSVQVGDLVKKRGAESTVPQNFGLVLNVDTNSVLIQVLGAKDCRVWVNRRRIEVVNESR